MIVSCETPKLSLLCFFHRGSTPSCLATLLINTRDSSIHVFGGFDIDITTWSICRYHYQSNSFFSPFFFFSNFDPEILTNIDTNPEYSVSCKGFQKYGSWFYWPSQTTCWFRATCTAVISSSTCALYCTVNPCWYNFFRRTSSHNQKIKVNVYIFFLWYVI